MDIKVFLLILIGFVGTISCQDELYDAVFKQTKPHLKRHEVIEMLQELANFYEKDLYEEDRYYRIHSVLKDSKVSEKKCKDFTFMFRLYSKIKGRAYDLLEESRLLQAKLCQEMWETSLLQSARQIDSNAQEAVRSMVKSIVDANGGRDFEGAYCLMAPERAQEGILRFMEKKSGGKLSKRTKEDKFTKMFEKYVEEPCVNYVRNMPDAVKSYTQFLNHPDLNIQLNPTALELSKNNLICTLIINYGYSTSPKRCFWEDTFRNLVNGYVVTG